MRAPDAMPQPTISILIPTLNAERDLERLLPALLAQRRWQECELCVIDSSSSDCTRQILRARGARVQRIERSQFRHGATRNQLVGLAKAEHCVFLSQDALPVGSDFLDELLRPLSDARVAGVTARVLPHPEDDPLTARTVLAAPEAASESKVHELPQGHATWPEDPLQRGELLRFNNVASCLRRSVLLELPFPDVPFGEDVAWAARVLSRGWRTAFAAKAVVQHAHRYTPTQAFERYRVDAVFQRRTHGLRVRPNLYSVLRGIAYEMREDLRHLSREGGMIANLWRSPALRVAQVVGQYCGSRGWNPRRGASGPLADYR